MKALKQKKNKKKTSTFKKFHWWFYKLFTSSCRPVCRVAIWGFRETASLLIKATGVKRQGEPVEKISYLKKISLNLKEKVWLKLFHYGDWK